MLKGQINWTVDCWVGAPSFLFSVNKKLNQPWFDFWHPNLTFGSSLNARSHVCTILIYQLLHLMHLKLKMLEVGILFDQQIFMYSRVVRKLLLSVHSDISSGDNMTRKSGTHLKCEFSTFWAPPNRWYTILPCIERRNVSFFWNLWKWFLMAGNTGTTATNPLWETKHSQPHSNINQFIKPVLM